jgi:hypothetical protein
MPAMHGATVIGASVRMRVTMACLLFVHRLNPPP